MKIGGYVGKTRGFSLMELVLVIAVLGILVGLYTSSTGDLSNVAIDAASRKVQSDIRYAHQLAVSTGVNHGAKFIIDQGYEVYRGSPGTPVIDPMTRQNLVVDLAQFEGVHISTNYQAEFDKIGNPVLGADSRVRLTSDSGAIRDVYVIDDTGAVVVDLIQLGTGCSCKLCQAK